MLSLLCSRHNGRLCMQVTKQRSTPLVVHACTSTTNPQTLFGWWSLGYRYAAIHVTSAQLQMSVSQAGLGSRSADIMTCAA